MDMDDIMQSGGFGTFMDPNSVSFQYECWMLSQNTVTNTLLIAHGLL